MHFITATGKVRFYSILSMYSIAFYSILFLSLVFPIPFPFTLPGYSTVSQVGTQGFRHSRQALCKWATDQAPETTSLLVKPTERRSWSSSRHWLQHRTSDLLFVQPSISPSPGFHHGLAYPTPSLKCPYNMATAFPKLKCHCNMATAFPEHQDSKAFQNIRLCVEEKMKQRLTGGVFMN